MSSNRESLSNKRVNQPLTSLIYRVGVAGHRRLETSHLPIFREQLKKIYRDIYSFLQKTRVSVAPRYTDESDSPVIQFVSSLAEGADRLCIEPGLIPFPYELSIILPFPREEYEKDFTPNSSVVDLDRGTIDEFRHYLTNPTRGIADGNTLPSVKELAGNTTRRKEAYAHCSRILAANSDLLIALFDGRISQNHGTAATVLAAKQEGIPVIHISTLEPGTVRITPPQLQDSSCQHLDYSIENVESLVSFRPPIL